MARLPPRPEDPPVAGGQQRAQAPVLKSGRAVRVPAWHTGLRVSVDPVPPNPLGPPALPLSRRRLPSGWSSRCRLGFIAGFPFGTLLTRRSVNDRGVRAIPEARDGRESPGCPDHQALVAGLVPAAFC
jgi:hypothetical protein